MPLVKMMYVKEVVTEDWLPIITSVAMDVFADELGTPDDEGGPLHRSQILIRPEPMRPYATNVHTLEFVASVHPYPSRVEDVDKLAQSIGDRIVYDFTNVMVLEGRLEEIRASGPLRCFVQLEFAEIGFSSFTIDGANPGCRQGQGLNH